MTSAGRNATFSPKRPLCCLRRHIPLQFFTSARVPFRGEKPSKQRLMRITLRKAGPHSMKSILRVLLMLVIGSLPAWAALGGDVSSVNSDAQVLGGEHKMLAKAGFSLHQITASDGSVVNEFVSPAGVVFG